MMETILSLPVIDALGITLIHSLWQGFLLYTVLILIKLIKPKMNLKLSYQLNTFTLFLLVGCMAVTFATYLPTSGVHSTEAFTPNNSIPIITEQVASKTISSELAKPTVYTEFNQQSSSIATHFSSFIVAAWLCGILFFSLRFYLNIKYSYQIRSKGIQPLNKVLEKKVHQIITQLNITKRVTVFQSTEVSMPLIVGYFKPIILIPVQLFSQVNVAQIEAILLHELAHLKRNDYLINMIVSALEVVLFYHPVYWWISSTMNEERELACDELAKNHLKNDSLYAETLFMVGNLSSVNSLAVGFSGKKKHLLNRIKRICLPNGNEKHFTLNKTKFFCSILLLFAFTAWSQIGVEELQTESIEQQKTELNTAGEKVIDNVKPEPSGLTPPLPPTPEAPLTLPKNVTIPAPVKETKENRKDKAIFKADVKRYAVDLTNKEDLPNIPKMRKNPKLPKIPKEINQVEGLIKELENGKIDHKEFKAKVAEYKELVTIWRTELKNDYLAAWNDRNTLLKEVYESWKEEVETKYEKDAVEYHEKLYGGDQLFAAELKKHETAVKKVEEKIEQEFENPLNKLESAFEKYLTKQKPESHSDKMKLHSDKMAVHELKMQVHGSKMSVHSTKMKIHSTKMNIHGARMQAHSAKLAVFKKEFLDFLFDYKNYESYLITVNPEREVTLNEEKLNDADAQKVIGYFNKYKIGMRENEDWHVLVKKEGTLILGYTLPSEKKDK